jgi:dTDP-4-dehydrorhamnose reductase
MKILITGCNGFLGNNLAKYFHSKDNEIFGIDLHGQPIEDGITYFKLDLTDAERTNKIILRIMPEMIINAVALVDLDICESNKGLAKKVNMTTAENVANAAGRIGARLIHISTDHLFLGNDSFYREDSIPDPVNYYGCTKLDAEEKCLKANKNTIIVRTNFYGWSYDGHKPTFGEWVYQSLINKNPINLFVDYYFTPIEVIYLCEALGELIKSDFRGIINIVGRQRCSKYEFGMVMAQVFGFDSSYIRKININGNKLAVRRQQDLSLSIEKFNKLFKTKLPDLIEGIKRMKDNYEKYN